MQQIAGSHAQAGIYYQNNLAAYFILESLSYKSDIEYIILENFDEAPHIDDIIIHRVNGIQHYQVKWSEDSDANPFTIYNLLAASKTDSKKSTSAKKSLLRKLADGYAKIRERHSKPLEIILYSNRRDSDYIPPNSNLSISLTELKTDILLPLRNSTYDQLNLTEKHRSTLKEIQTNTGLDDDQRFYDFLSMLHIETKSDDLEALRKLLKERLRDLGVEDNLLGTLIDHVCKWSIEGKPITRDIILSALGLGERFAEPVLQRFSVVDEEYVENTYLFDKLDSAISQLPGGFIFIEGSPGSGKSTAITKYRQRNQDVRFTYYCNIPDENDIGNRRYHEDVFVKAMCSAIETTFSDTDLPYKYSKDFSWKLDGYLRALSSLSRKVIFIIDGLDHVYRSLEFESNSLLNWITGRCPDNIFFILTSRHSSVLTAEAKAEIATDDIRHIIIDPFTIIQTSNYLERKNIIDSKVIEIAYSISGGIPLYLHYLSEELLGLAVNDQLLILGKIPNSDKNKLNGYHEHLYSCIEGDVHKEWILAILAFRRELTPNTTICSIFEHLGINSNRLDIEKVLNSIRQVLKRANVDQYSIFHSSFREFVIRKNSDRKDEINRAIVAYYATDPESDESYRNLFQHLFELGQWEEILASTNHSWVERAWQCYRSVDEIERNVGIAWHAAAEIGSLTEFIRISFLLAQVNRVAGTLDYSDFNFPHFLLRARLTKESLRNVWDGSKVLLSNKALIKYALAYRTQTKRQLPSDIMNWLDYGKIEAEEDFAADAYCLKIINTEDPSAVIREIARSEWEDQFKNKLSPEETVKYRNLLIRKSLDFLYGQKSYALLQSVIDSFGSDTYPHRLAKIKLAQLLAPVNKADAFKQLQQCTNLSKMPYSDSLAAISFLSDFLSDDEIRNLWVGLDLKEIEFHVQVIDDSPRAEYRIRKDIISLFERLKCGIIFQESQSGIELQSSILIEPSRSIYMAVLDLATLWSEVRGAKAIGAEDLLRRLKLILDQLDISKEFIDERNDYVRPSSESYFIARDIYKIYLQLFEFAKKELPTSSLKQFLVYWIKLYKGDDGYKHHSSGLKIAQYLAEVVPEAKADLLEVIKHAESLARQEEETSMLFEYLLEVALTYKQCEYSDDFKRVYSSILNVTFGLHWKKDYRSASIAYPMKLMHSVDPGNSLERIAEVFQSQRQLINAGRSRMYHISVSQIIAHVAEINPDLAFHLLEHEEEDLHRPETMYYVLKSMIQVAIPEHLPLIWCILNTMQRWEKDEDNYPELCNLLLAKTLLCKNLTLASRISEDLKTYALVDRDLPEQISKSARFLKGMGFDANKVGLTMDNESSQSPEVPEAVSDPDVLQIEQVASLLTHNKADDFMGTLFHRMTISKRIETLKHEYHTFRRHVIGYYDSLNTDDKKDWKSKKRSVLAVWRVFANKIVYSSPHLKLSDVREAINELRQTLLSLDSSASSLLGYMEDNVEFDSWIYDTIERLNYSRTETFNYHFTRSDAIILVDKAGVVNHRQLHDFINAWMAEACKVNSLLMLSNQLIALDIQQARLILNSITDYSYFSLGNDETKDTDTAELFEKVLQAMMKVDRNYGRRFLLNSFRIQSKGYDVFIHQGVPELIKHEGYFEDGSNAIKTYFNSNLIYNQELAKGLPLKDVDYDFIKTFVSVPFEEGCVRYLISLLSYPVIKVRFATLKALYSLVMVDQKYVRPILDAIISDDSEQNRIEYGLVLVYAIALTNAKSLDSFKASLMTLSNSQHFNIAEASKEILLLLHCTSPFLSAEQLDDIERVNKPTYIVLPEDSGPLLRGREFVYSAFLTSLLTEIDDDNATVAAKVYTDVARGRYSDYESENESDVHKRYNINDNFDEIEINSPYTDAMRSNINRIFQNRVKSGYYDPDFTDYIKRKLRLCDPSELIYSRTSRLEEVDWLLTSLDKESYMGFTDEHLLLQNLLNRSHSDITLFEGGSQRTIEKSYGAEYRISKFTVYAFAVAKGTSLNFNPERNPLVSAANYYSHEIPAEFPESSTFFDKAITPMLGMSVGKYRGAESSASVMLLPDIAKQIDGMPLFDVRGGKSNYFSFRCWQDPYTTYGRRRYKPISEGVTLTLKRAQLLNFLISNQLDLYYCMSLKRAVGRNFDREYRMDWRKKTLVEKANL